jgi:hypothetical protein
MFISSESSLCQSIINTLAYFDLADYPLTKEELFSFLWQPPVVSYPDFLKFLLLRESAKSGGEATKSNGSVSKNQGDCRVLLAMTEKFGYYFLSGREAIAEERRRKLLISEQKLKIARRAARIIKSIPFLRAVFACNTAGSGQANEGSDIDFFIVTEKNRIWITRLLITFVLEAFRLRRAGKRIKNKICLSFYVTVENLDLAKWRVADDDIHFAYWLNQMLPIFDPDNYYVKFLQANQWTKAYLPNIGAKQSICHSSQSGNPVDKSLIAESRLSKLWKKAWEKMWDGSYGDFINSQAKKIQLYKIKMSGKPIDRGEDKGVVISDGVLKFHEKDTRIKYLEKWKSKILNFKF